MGDKHRTEFLNETVLASVKSTGLNGIGEIFIETIDEGTLARNINVSLEDYQEINAATREEILAYLEVSAEAMNNRLRQEFGEEMEADIF